MQENIPPRAGNNVLDAALEYYGRGFCVIPIPGGTKAARVSWRKYQTVRPDLGTVRKWFANGKPSLAIIAGEVSGGLVVRDFDDMATYDRWAGLHPELASTLPTVETFRGRHVYCRADIGQIRAASPSNGSTIDLGDGELRGGGYTLAPPSKHPKGAVYRWLVPLPAGELPFLDLKTAGILSCDREDIEHREDREHRENGEDRENRGEPKRLFEKGGVDSPPLSTREKIDLAILQTMPERPGQRRRRLFEFARHLKALPIFADAPASAAKSCVRQWHALALPNIGTKPFEETWFDFGEGWGRVKFPKGKGPLAMLLQKIEQVPLPEAALEYEQRKLQLLVAVCRELQRVSGKGPFYLTVRAAGELLGVDHATAARWLRGLRRDEVLQIVSEGSIKSHQASRYRYLREL